MIYISNGRPVYIENDVLMHYGVKGMKWGVRKRIQDVSNGIRKVKSRFKQVGNSYNRFSTKARNMISGKKPVQPNKNMTPEEVRKQKAKRAVKIGAAVAGTVIAAYGYKKLKDALNESSMRNHQKMIERIQRQHDLSYQRYWLSQNTPVRPRR